jgi:hypothetical protein
MAIQNNNNKISKIVAWDFIDASGGGVSLCCAGKLKAALTVE